MAKTLVEMTAEIIQAQAGETPMTPDEIAATLNKIYEALESVKAIEEQVAEKPPVEKKVVKGKASTKRRKVAKEKGLGKRVAKAGKGRVKA